MKIPTRIKVGRKKYVVKQLEVLRGSRRGHWTSAGLIAIGRKTELGTRYDAKHKAEAFWHELTHAILHDMKAHRLNRDEPFVEEFARKLNDAIHSAEFE